MGVVAYKEVQQIAENDELNQKVKKSHDLKCLKMSR